MLAIINRLMNIENNWYRLKIGPRTCVQYRKSLIVFYLSGVTHFSMTQHVLALITEWTS